ncbi:MFS general substrate transporter [Pterulicium gracile]|uniref:MFS general substrate transporter n=1 Tax=Pterulicium gracile TaxID=1884261 RepID=A0A5C3R0S9_9AGAR|nr:MFS general substrate transporter [Pterula gracilis]
MSSKDQIETNLDRSTKQGLNSKDKAYIADSAEHASQDDEILEHALPPADSEERNTLERALVRKLDLRLLPMIFLIYIMNYIDRNAITSARLKGLQEDLHLNNIQYATLIAVLYATYSPAQIPSNMILHMVKRPSLYIGTCVVLWGLTSALTGVTVNYGGIIACRIFIGLPEAAFYPGAMYLLSRWYTRRELALRSAILYCGLLLSNAFGTLMAAGILSGMEGAMGIRAWRWLFYIEGAITVVIGFISMYILPDYPNNTRWIVGVDRRLAQARLAEDAAEADIDDSDQSQLHGLKLALKDPLVLMFALMNMVQLMGLSFINFFPSLTQTLGFSTTITLLMASPPWIWASILCLGNAWHADRTGERYFHIAACWWAVMLGYIISLSTMNIAARYISLFLMATGYSGFAMILTWVSSSVPRPPAKRAVSMGIVNGFGNLGNLIGSYVWDAKWSPDYHPSLGICLGALGLTTILGGTIRQMIITRNKEMLADELKLMTESNRVRIEEAAKLEGISFEDAMARRRGFKLLY